MGKRKSWNYNYAQHKRKKTPKGVLEIGMRGFLCTCNAKEKECIREAYNILGSYGEKLYGEEKLMVIDFGVNDDQKDKETEIEDELKKEVESLKSNDKKYVERRFQVVDFGANNCIFIKTTLSDPVELVQNILEDIEKTRQRKSRYLLRMVPIEVTCKAYLDDIKKHCEKLFEKHFKCDPVTYGITYNKRYNDKVIRNEIIESLVQLIKDRNILHKVDLKQPKKTVIIEIIKNLCCISVVPDYHKYKKYNLMELTKTNFNNDCINPEKHDTKSENTEKAPEEKSENVEKSNDCEKNDDDFVNTEQSRSSNFKTSEDDESVNS